jgi:hypothetical protein
MSDFMGESVSEPRNHRRAGEKAFSLVAGTSRDTGRLLAGPEIVL